MYDITNFDAMSCWLLVEGDAPCQKSVALLNSLGVEYEEISITPHRFGHVVGWLGSEWQVENLPTAPYPQLVVGSGKLAGFASRYIKQRNPTTFTIQTEYAPKPLYYFDIVMPENTDIAITTGYVRGKLVRHLAQIG